MKRLLPLICLLTGNLAMAHGPEGESSPQWRPPVRAVKPPSADTVETVKLDLKVEGTTLKLFILDRYGEPVAIDIAEAKAFVSSAGKTTWFSLRPAGMNMLSGQGEFEPDSNMRVDISLRLPGRRPISRNFYPLRR